MKQYHRENLKKELIETGIEFIHQYGIQELSLRQLAREVGVSESAPYRHFKNKEDLIKAMDEYVCHQFCDELNEAVRKENEEGILFRMGEAYVRFFEKHPSYYPFLFSNAKLNLDLEDEHCYLPLSMLKQQVIRQFPNKEEKEIRLITLQMWSLVHTAAYMISQNPESGFTESDLKDFLLGGMLC